MIENVDYTVRVSHRARRARIVVRPNRSVEVVLPHGLPNHHAADFVREKRVWIERSLKRFGETAKAQGRDHKHPLPQQLLLDGIGLNLSVNYTRTDSDRIRLVEMAEGLEIRGAVDDVEKVRLALRRWLKTKAKELLPPMLASLSEQYGYQYGKVTIRLQKSRWGSCSRAGSVSLNAKLLFLAPHLLRYVMLHELAHLKHLNHSALFWAEVARSDPDCRSHVREMRRVNWAIPDWVGS